MRKNRSPITKVVLAILVVLALIFLVVQCEAGDDGGCSDNSLATTTMAPAAFSLSKPGGKPVGKGGKGGGASKSGGHRGGFFGGFFGGNDCD
ncbi:hypothetical protein [Streptomyces sp. NPDC048636]|uniref:hypothetical protein n=1 Tax=Streptomyces sp. NPDC048636 TaxID=3155762 RepID=UPI00341370E1